MDKWLWAARFFKARALAVKACELGRVQSNGVDAKPARDVKVGDLLRIRNEAAVFEVEVLELREMRGPAAVAQTMYRETEESKAERARAVEMRKAMGPIERLEAGRPSKKDRRELEKFREGF